MINPYLYHRRSLPCALVKMIYNGVENRLIFCNSSQTTYPKYGERRTRRIGPKRVSSSKCIICIVATVVFREAYGSGNLYSIHYGGKIAGELIESDKYHMKASSLAPWRLLSRQQPYVIAAAWYIACGEEGEYSNLLWRVRASRAAAW